MSDTKRGPGRPIGGGTSTGKKNVTIDAETLVLLHTAKRNLSEQVGVDLTLTQTVRLLIKRAGGASA